MLVRMYQVTLSPILGGNCRFYPSCSEYGIQSIKEHGPLHGTKLTIQRLSKCHPFGKSGYDPVPTEVKQHE